MSDPGGTIQSLFTGRIREVRATGSAEWWDRPWQTGFYKEAELSPCWLGYEGLRPDEQADRRFHGGVDKAVCVYPVEYYGHWHRVLAGTELPQGAFGENFTTRGLLGSEVCIGDRFAVGEAEVQVSQPRQPCWKLARRWRIKDLTAQVERTGFTGFYFRVLRHGYVQAGDGFALLERPWPQWSVDRCNDVMQQRKNDPEEARELAACPALSASWKDGLYARVQAMPRQGPPEARVTPP